MCVCVHVRLCVDTRVFVRNGTLLPRFFPFAIVPGWAWQSRPDKWTQIASGDRWKRSVYSPSIAPHVLSIARVWLRQGCMMDGWMPESISFKCSLRSVALSHFFSSLCFISLSLCCLYHFAICFGVVVFLLLSPVPYFNVHYYSGVREGVFNMRKTHIAISVQKNRKLLTFCVTFTKFDAVTVCFSQKKKNKKQRSRPDNSDGGQMPASMACNNDAIWKTTFLHSGQSLFGSR